MYSSKSHNSVKDILGVNSPVKRVLAMKPDDKGSYPQVESLKERLEHTQQELAKSHDSNRDLKTKLQTVVREKESVQVCTKFSVGLFICCLNCNRYM
jgi:hypothetical protein